MSFFGKSFIFDGKSSELYNLYITSSEDGGFAKTIGAGDTEIITQKIFRRPDNYLLGATPSPVLTFEIEMTSPLEILAQDIQVITSWLCGQSQYKKLQIHQFDIMDVYFNCFITQPKIMKTGNKIIGLCATVVCDRPYGLNFPKTLIKTYGSTGSVTDNFVFYNISDHNGFEYPSVQFTINTTGTEMVITNNSDDGRGFFFTGLTAGETITVNNDLNIITSSLTLNRLSHFNKNWFRLVKGVNNLAITGNPSSVTFTYSPARKIGG